MTLADSSSSHGSNCAPLEYWRLRGYSSKDIDIVSQHIDDSHAVRIRFGRGLKFEITISNKISQTHQGHFPAVANIVRDLIATWKGPEPVGDLLFALDDGVGNDNLSKRAPLISYGKRCGDNFEQESKDTLQLLRNILDCYRPGT